VREHKDMTSTYKNRGKLRINRVMNVIGFEYPNYTNTAPNAEAREKRKRTTKASGGNVVKKTANDDTEDEECEYDKESPSSKALSSKKNKAKISEKKILVAQEQGKGSTSTTSSLGCT
jgi:hypothetical protein